MPIPNPFPNIKDYDLSDNKTLSSSKISAGLNVLKSEIEDIKDTDINLKASGSIANFETKTAAPLVEAEFTISVSGGTTKANIYHTGSNIWDEEWQTGYYSSGDGAYNTQNNTICSKNDISAKPNTEYYFYSGSLPVSIYFYDEDGNYISFLYHRGNQVITTPANCHIIKWSADYGSGSTYNNDISINYPATDTEYHAYNADSSSKNITWTTAVENGIIDLINGTVYDSDLETTQTFTGSNFTAFSGINNIWCDTGDSEVTYKKKIKDLLN